MPGSPPIPLNYGRHSWRSRVPWTRVLIVCALLISPLILPHYATQITTLNRRFTAHAQLRTYFNECLRYTRSDAGPSFDETHDPLPVFFYGTSWRAGRPMLIQFRGDVGVALPKELDRGFSSLIYPSRRVERKLLNVKYLSAEACGRSLCMPACFPRPEAFGPAPYHSWEGDVYELFVHGRSAAGRGARRLVGVTFDATTFTAGDTTPLTIYIYSSPGLLPGNWCRKVARHSLGFPCSPSEPLRLFYGQPDPTDASHFTIRYSAGQRQGVIHGRLQRDDSVTLTAEESPLTSK